MAFEDEIRIRKKRALEEEEKKAADASEEIGSIYDEKVIIHTIETSFEERQIGNLPCYMYMPKSFKELTEEEKKKAFARTTPPPYAYSSDDLLFYVSVGFTGKALANEQIREFIGAIKGPLTAMIPQCEIFKTYVLEKGDARLGCVECISGGIPMPLYNLMVYMSVEGKLVILNVYTVNDLKKSVFPYMEQMVKSIRFEEERKED